MFPVSNKCLITKCRAVSKKGELCFDLPQIGKLLNFKFSQKFPLGKVLIHKPRIRPFDHNHVLSG